MFKDNMIVSNFEPGVQYLDEQRQFLERGSC